MAEHISPFAPISPLPGQHAGHYRPQHAALEPDPLGQTTDTPSAPSSQGPRASPGEQHTQPHAPPTGHLRITIDAIERNKSELSFRLSAESSLSTFRQRNYAHISRTYTDFLHLASALASGNPHVIVPAVPAPTTSALTEEDDDRRVKASLQLWLARVTADPFLARDANFRLFVEADFGYVPVEQGGAPDALIQAEITGTHLPGAYSDVSGDASSSTSASDGIRTANVDATTETSDTSSYSFFRRTPVLPIDELTAARAALATLDRNFDGTLHTLASHAKAKRAHAVAQLDSAAALGTLATAEPNTELARVLRRLARVSQSFADISGTLADADLVSVYDTAAYERENARAARATLGMRERVLDDFRASGKVLVARRRALERLKNGSTLNAVKVDAALEDFEDAKMAEATLARQVRETSANLAPSLRRHLRNVQTDVLGSLVAHAKTNLLYERQALREAESARADMARRSAGENPPRVRYLSAEEKAGERSGPSRGTGEGPLSGAPGSPNQSKAAATSSNGKRSIQSMAQSVVIANNPKQRVDPKMAASMLANRF